MQMTRNKDNCQSTLTLTLSTPTCWVKKKSYQFFLNKKYHHTVFTWSQFSDIWFKRLREKLADHDDITTNRHADIHYVDQNVYVYHAGNELLWSRENTDKCRPHTCHYHYTSGLHSACVVHDIPDPSSRRDRHTALRGSRRYRDITPDRRLTATIITRLSIATHNSLHIYLTVPLVWRISLRGKIITTVQCTTILCTIISTGIMSIEQLLRCTRAYWFRLGFLLFIS